MKVLHVENPITMKNINKSVDEALNMGCMVQIVVGKKPVAIVDKEGVSYDFRHLKKLGIYDTRDTSSTMD